MATTDMIRFENVKKIYTGLDAKSKDIVALHNVNLSIKKGEFVFVLGHSGAGKSTFLKLILREEAATEGKVFVNGRDLSSIRQREIPYLRRGLGVVFQDFRLIPTMTAYENVAFAMRVTNIPERQIKRRVPYVLNLVGLAGKAHSLPQELSGGEQQRIALARALVHSPPIIIADEPTGNIDPELSVEIMELLQAINSVGTTVVVVTHERELAARFRKRTIMIDHGEVVDDGLGRYGEGGRAGMKWSSFKYLVKQGWHSMVANRLMTLASIGVLVACLMITGVAALLSVNVTSYVDYLETLNEIVFFIDDAAPAETVEALKTQIPADGNVAACEYVPKAAAVEEMREYLGDYGDIMNDYAGEGNTENPLPASFRVSVTDVADLAPTVERIKAMGAYTATAEDGTASDANVFYKVNSPSELSSTLVNLKRIVNYIGWGLVAVLGVVSVVVISNTIRLTVFARRKEINIMKFVGATNAFIRLPFFVEGMTVGAISGVLATVVVGGAYYGLEQALLQPEALWLNEFTKCMWPFMDIIWPLLGGFVLFGVAIGGVGCASSIRKHLKV